LQEAFFAEKAVLQTSFLIATQSFLQRKPLARVTHCKRALQNRALYCKRALQKKSTDKRSPIFPRNTLVQRKPLVRKLFVLFARKPFLAMKERDRKSQRGKQEEPHMV